MEQALDKLFESGPKIKLLRLFLMNPEREFTLAEIVKHAQLQPAAAKKELIKLLKISLVKSKIVTVPAHAIKKVVRRPKQIGKQKKSIMRPGKKTQKKSKKIYKTKSKKRK